MSDTMFVNVTPEQFDRLRQCVIAFEDGRRGPDGWTVDDVRGQLGMWTLARGGNYNRLRHELGEPVEIKVIGLARASATERTKD